MHGIILHILTAVRQWALRMHIVNHDKELEICTAMNWL
jgi:hypothetical protein